MKFEVKTEAVCATIITIAAYVTIVIIQLYGVWHNWGVAYQGWYPIMVTLILILILSLSYIAKYDGHQRQWKKVNTPAPPFVGGANNNC